MESSDSFRLPQKPNPSEIERVSEKLNSIMIELSSKKFDALKTQLIHCLVTNPTAIKNFASLIFTKAVLEPTYCALYALLCSDLIKKLPQFRCDEPGLEITFRRILVNKCDQEFVDAMLHRSLETKNMMSPTREREYMVGEPKLKLPKLGIIRFMGELINHKILNKLFAYNNIFKKLWNHDDKTLPSQENVELLCQLLMISGKELDKAAYFRQIIDTYLGMLKDLRTRKLLGFHMLHLIQDVFDLRANNWVPKLKEWQVEANKNTHELTSDRLMLHAFCEQLKETMVDARILRDTYIDNIGISATNDSIEAFHEADSGKNIYTLLEEMTVDVKKLSQLASEEHARCMETVHRLQVEFEEHEKTKQLFEIRTKENAELKAQHLTSLRLIRKLLKSHSSGTSLASSSQFRFQGKHQHPSYFLCPISQDIMKDPHIAADGHTYEKEELMKWFCGGHYTSPMTNLRLPYRDLIPNHALRSAIEEWHQRQE